MSWVESHWRMILAILSSLAGAILGVAAQEILDTKLRLTAAILALISIAVVALIVALIALIESRHVVDRTLLGELHATSAENEHSASALNRKLDNVGQSLIGEMHKLSRHMGLQVDKMLLREVNDLASISDDRTIQLILEARSEICILDLLPENGRWPDEAFDQAYQNTAFEAFRKHLKEKSPSLTYKRIVQVADPTISLRNAKTSAMIKHCHDMLNLHNETNRRIVLRVTRRRFPFKLILIDRTALVLQLEEYGSNGDNLQIWGEIIVVDPGSQLVGVFRDIWDEVDNDPQTRTVTISDLPETRILKD